VERANAPSPTRPPSFRGGAADRSAGPRLHQPGTVFDNVEHRSGGTMTVRAGCVKAFARVVAASASGADWVSTRTSRRRGRRAEARHARARTEILAYPLVGSGPPATACASSI